jgi:hypothetical protein
MKKSNTRILAAMSLAIASSVASAQTPAFQNQLVTVENYNRAQSDIYFAGLAKSGGFGNFRHGRELVPPTQRGIIRPNRDTFYSLAVFDLDAGLVAITLPDGAKRFMAMQILNEDQYTKCVYNGAGTHTLTREMVGTRYAMVAVRFLMSMFQTKRRSGKSEPCRMPSRSARKALARSLFLIGMRRASRR